MIRGILNNLGFALIDCALSFLHLFRGLAFILFSLLTLISIVPLILTYLPMRMFGVTNKSFFKYNNDVFELIDNLLSKPEKIIIRAIILVRAHSNNRH